VAKVAMRSATSVRLTQLFFFVCLWVLPVVADFLRKSIDWGALLKSLDEVGLAICLPLAIRGFRKLWTHRAGRRAVLFFIAFLSFGIVSAMLRSTPFIQALYQFFLELKILLFVITVFGFSESCSKNVAHVFISLAKIILGSSFVLALVQLYSPQTYDALFPYGGHHGVFLTPDGTGLPRAAGTFWFTGGLAVFSGVFLTYFYFLYLQQRTWKALFWACVSAADLLLTLSRLEIVATVGAIAVVSFASKGVSRKIIFLAIAPVITLVLFITFQDLISSYLSAVVDQLKLDNIEESQAARSVFYWYGWQLATEYFPFGSGLGTFGGQAAAVFDSIEYARLGFERFWFYRNGVWMTDTFWPHIYAEAGFLGALCLAMHFYSLIRMYRNKQNIFAKAGKAGMLILLINSLTSPNFYIQIDYISTLILFWLGFLQSSVVVWRGGLHGYSHRH